MNWFQRLRQSLADPAPVPRGTPGSAKSAPPPPAGSFLETSRVVAFGILFATVVAIVFIAFVGVSPVAVPVLENQLASVRVVAADTFKYESRVRTEQARDQVRSRVPPVSRLKFAPLEVFTEHVRELAAALEKFEQQHVSRTGPARLEDIRAHLPELAAIVETFNARGPYRLGVEDVVTILGLGDLRFRRPAFENGLLTLRELYQEGISDEAHDLAAAPDGVVSSHQIRGAKGEVVQARVQSREEALTFLRVNLGAEGVGREGAAALFRLFRHGVTNNLEFDAETTEQLRARAVANLKPIVVTVQKGQVLLEAGQRVTRDQYEALVAHRRHLLDHAALEVSGHLQLFARMLLVFAMVLGAAFYIRLEDRATLTSNSRLGLLALVVIVNLALVRATYAAGDLSYFVREDANAAVLPYLAPTVLAPLIVAILLGSGPAIFTALIVSLFTGVIYGNRLELLVVTLFASIVAVFHCRKARNRARVVRAGFLSGLCVAVFALLLGAADHLGSGDREVWLTIFKQMGAGLVTGLLTGVAVVGILPMLEALFRRTTDITLLELTDHNHPLLQLMQIEAPGTYHHSLWVANLAENAAAAIGANPLVCRAAALFHDVGKTTKPEFFTENQRDRTNPHDDCSPAVSALAIKNHVRDGVELARKHDLPKVIVDVIRQHHGTTLMQFFYHRAKKEARTPMPDPAAPGGVALPVPDVVEEALYRYDGPKPRFKESAIIFFADCVEAASRSLRNVTPQHLSELIDRLFKERIEDGQLEQCPLTYEDVAKIKASFEFTLLNMLHSRVAYPIGESAGPAAGGPSLAALVPGATTPVPVGPPAPPAVSSAPAATSSASAVPPPASSHEHPGPSAQR